MDKLLKAVNYFFDSNWFPANFVTITEIPSEIIQKLTNDCNNIEIKNYNAKDQILTFAET